MPRTLAITKKVSLADIAKGWNDQCFALVSPATYGEYIEFVGLQDAGKTNVEIVQYQLDFVKKHFISGQVMVLDENGAMVLVPMEAEDIDASRGITDLLFKEIVGVPVDPKDSSTPTETLPTQPDTNAL